MPEKQAVDAAALRQKRHGYWNARRHMLYYKAVQQFVSVIGDQAKTLVDIGSGSAEYTAWFDWIPDRYVLDIHVANPPPGVTAINTDFLEFVPEFRFDVALCLQVLEHIDDPTKFCDKLKTLSKRLLISVPYKWLGNAEGHIHDPVDEEKLRSWMGLMPNNSQIVYEPFREGRLIAFYDLENGPGYRFDTLQILDSIDLHTNGGG